MEINKPNYVGIGLAILVYAVALYAVNQPIPGPLFSFAYSGLILPYVLTGYVAERVQHPIGSFLAATATYFGSAIILIIPLAILAGI